MPSSKNSKKLKFPSETESRCSGTKVKKRTKFSSSSELRLDLISGDWVIIATGRAKRPEMFKREKREKEKIPGKNCPFCPKNFQDKPLLSFKNTMVIPNKFPAFLPQPKWEKKIEANLYETMNAVGFCEVVVTKDHEKSLALLPKENIKEVLDCYQKRYLALMDKPFVSYVSIFHNQGLGAGASIYHPHSQIITTPLIDVDLKRALLNSENYYKKTGRCIYCQMNNWERKARKRIVFENKDFLVICPFASKTAFEIIISPKLHLPYFEKITEKEKQGLAQAFKAALSKLYSALNDPDYNFYLHTSPCDNKKYPYYHWHWTILPKTQTWAGFELGARMEISTITPEKAAEYLRKQ